jgi:hypothetical protein
VDEHRYDVEVLHLLVSPGHNYFGRPKDGPGSHPSYDLDEVRLVAGKGIVGDRFFGQAAHLDAAVTLFAVEALAAIAADLGLDPVPDPLLTRRNVVLRGPTSTRCGARRCPRVGGRRAAARSRGPGLAGAARPRRRGPRGRAGPSAAVTTTPT